MLHSIHHFSHPMSLIVAFSLVIGACKKQVGPATNEAGLLSESISDDGMIEQQIDINGDGIADVYNFYRELKDSPRQLVRKEVDLNWDGKVDVRTWFTESNQIDKEEMDGDFDGRVDWVDHYQGGKRVMSEVDTDNNGTFDLFRIYEQGKVRRKERDTTGDGQIDFWEYLDDNERVIKMGRDIDGDGVMDIRED